MTTHVKAELPPALEPFVRQRTTLLTSFRKDGTPIGTPVHVAVEDGRAFFRTWDAAWKARRLSRNPAVELAPSTVRGRPTGETVQARARLLEGDEEALAAHALTAKYRLLHGVLIPWFHRRKGWRTLHYELTPA
jgi:PPOX class probable F420-dependent enzyme